MYEKIRTVWFFFGCGRRLGGLVEIGGGSGSVSEIEVVLFRRWYVSIRGGVESGCGWTGGGDCVESCGCGEDSGCGVGVEGGSGIGIGLEYEEI